MHKNLESIDPDIYKAIEQEKYRQVAKLELIASENVVSDNVLEAMGSVFTNKYAEGYPSKRYYGGCENVDIVENLAIQRAKTIFDAQHANVQAHSGSQANMACYLAVLQPGDTLMGMDLSHGGHLTHGLSVNFSGLFYNTCSYGVDANNHLIDYDQVRKLAKEHKPKLIIAGASAYPRKIDFEAFDQIAKEVGAYLLVDMAHIAGLVATKHHNSPIPYADFVTTTTHKTLRGPRGGMILCKEEYAKKVNSRIFPGIQGGPFCHIIAAKAVAFKETMQPYFTAYIEQVIQNAQTLAQSLLEKGYSLVSKGTDNHLILLDLSNTEITGKQAEQALDKCNITVNKNTIPFEKRSPMVTSGLRIGTPALTSRGLKNKDIKTVVNFIDKVLNNIQNEAQLNKISKEVEEFSKSFPIFDYSSYN